MVTRLGFAAIAFAEATGALALRLARALRAIVALRVDMRETVRQSLRFGQDALPLVVIASLAVGGVVAMQGLGYLQRYFATEVFGWAAFLSSFRDIGPMLVAFCLAARSGCRNAAELASMAARERIDAVRALGLDPERVVVVPRMLATVIVAVALYLPACALVVITGFVLARVIGDQNLAVSFWSVLEYAEPTAIAQGMLRMALFGLLIGLSSCHAGMRVQHHRDKSARAIGGAVYSSSVLCMGGIVVINLIVSLLGGAE